MEPIALGLIGCGRMGSRHLFGLEELARHELRVARLVAVCDRDEERARLVARQAEASLGEAPAVFTSAETMFESMQGLDAVDVVTDTTTHHTLASLAFAAGKHVLIEKPLAATVRAGREILDAAARSGCILSVAENYRRDPMNRLAKALLAGGAVGTPTMYLELHAGGGDQVVGTPWRHRKASGGPLLEQAVHYADVMQYLLGPVREVAARARLLEQVRRVGRVPAATDGMIGKPQTEGPTEVPAEAEDTAAAVLTFESGVLGTWFETHAGHGQGLTQRIAYGNRGSLRLPPDRSGQPVQLAQDGRAEALSDERLFDFAPGFALEPAAARLFGAERLARYQLSFPEIDRKLIALEILELAEGIREGRRPEVDGRMGLRAVALVMALLESATLGRPVLLADVEEGSVAIYQQEIETALAGLRP